jgi:cell division protease FtsH
MSRSKTTRVSHQSDTLARAYLALLSGQHPSRKQGSRSRKKSRLDPVESLLDEFDAPTAARARRLRPDLAMTAILVARAIEGQEGLARTARGGQTIISIETGAPHLVPLVREVVETCVISSECEVVHDPRQIGYSRPAVYIVNRDGSSKDHRPEAGNDSIAASVHEGIGVIGIAADARVHLPSDLLRLADFQLGLPSIDNDAVAILLDHLCGDKASAHLDERTLAWLEMQDITLSVRPDMSADECVRRIEDLVARKRKAATEGPRLDNLAGYGAAKKWGLDAVADFEDLRAGRIEWDEFDHRGLLLAGPPGVGKTAFVAALARSAEVPLIATSVASWNAATYLSGTLQAMNEAFSKARKAAPSILFIDELDGISDRSAIGGEHREYWSQIVNRLLELLQGIDEREGVVVIGATNFPNAIDPAIRRAGRLDREITINRPEPSDLAQIFRQYLGEDLAGADLAPLGDACRGRTGADVEAIVRRARGAARRRRRPLELADITSEIAPPSLPAGDSARRSVAFHEAGHAIVAMMLNTFEVVSANISGMDGLTQTKVNEEIADQTWLDDVLAVCMAGRAAERIALGRVSAGAGGRPGSDLDHATRIAIEMEIRFGFGKDGPLYLDCSDRRQALSLPGIMGAVRARIANAEVRATEIIEQELPALKRIAGALLANDEVDGPELKRLLDPSDSHTDSTSSNVSTNTLGLGRAA